jgi:3-hydroxyacyl-CoA dehydrogenase
MGAAIAAHLANAGLQVDLLDVVPTELTDTERAAGLSLDSPKVRNRIAEAGLRRVAGSKTPSFMAPEFVKRVRAGNLTDNFDRLRDVTWIIEAIVEKLEPKRDLMQRIEELNTGAVVSSNTSGIPLEQIAAGRSGEFRSRFVGTHFFNPPRYMKLVEVIPTGDTDPALTAAVSRFCVNRLGKGVVLARDTPNFIANRIGSFTSGILVRYALDNGSSIEEVDALTGELIGRPKTATFRLTDIVGLDVRMDVLANLYENTPEDESRDVLLPVEPLERMRAAGILGNKTGGGFYKRARRDGKDVFDVIDLETLEYRPAKRVDLPLIAEASRIRDLGERLRFILDRADTDPAAAFIRHVLLTGLAYAARRAPEIAHSPADVDRAMEWGYAHQAGPFRLWDMLGVAHTVATMDSLDILAPDWVRSMLAGGNTSFYIRTDDRELVWSTVSGRYEPISEDGRHISLARLHREKKAIEGNESSSLIDLGDGVLCWEFHSRNSVRDAGVVEMGRRALDVLEAGRSGAPWAGLVIANDAANFCIGADLKAMLPAAEAGEIEAIEKRVAESQQFGLRLRYSSKPVVAAIHGQCLGGGTELAMHCDRVVAAAETYMGLVEVGVGLIPGGGGCKELVRRVVTPSAVIDPSLVLPFLEKIFQTIALATVSSSAFEARELGFLAQGDAIVMNRDHVLASAKAAVLAMAGDYQPPTDTSVFAAGLPALAALTIRIRQMQWAGYASEYDGCIGERLATILCGGDLSAGQLVPEEYILRLEREAFVKLLQEERTLDRIRLLLQTGKHLRN